MWSLAINVLMSTLCASLQLSTIKVSAVTEISLQLLLQVDRRFNNTGPFKFMLLFFSSYFVFLPFSSLSASPPLSRRKKMLLNASQGAGSTSSDTNNNHGNNDITRRMLLEVVDDIKDDLSYLHRRCEEDELFAGVRTEEFRFTAG